MTKECQIIKNNEVVTVAKFGDIEVQFPAIHKDAKTVFVSYDGSHYKIVEKPEVEKSARKIKSAKKTTIEVSEEPEVAQDESV